MASERENGILTATDVAESEAAWRKMASDALAQYVRTMQREVMSALDQSPQPARLAGDATGGTR